MSYSFFLIISSWNFFISILTWSPSVLLLISHCSTHFTVGSELATAICLRYMMWYTNVFQRKIDVMWLLCRCSLYYVTIYVAYVILFLSHPTIIVKCIVFGNASDLSMIKGSVFEIFHMATSRLRQTHIVRLLYISTGWLFLPTWVKRIVFDSSPVWRIVPVQRLSLLGELYNAWFWHRWSLSSDHRIGRLVFVDGTGNALVPPLSPIPMRARPPRQRWLSP